MYLKLPLIYLIEILSGQEISNNGIPIALSVHSKKCLLGEESLFSLCSHFGLLEEIIFLYEIYVCIWTNIYNIINNYYSLLVWLGSDIMLHYATLLN